MMRSLACVLVAMVVATSTVGVLPLTCLCDGTVAGTHSCCAAEMASTGSATCCAVTDGTGQPGPAEAVAVAPTPAVAPIRPTVAAWSSALSPVCAVVSAPAFEPAPLYLQQRSLLI